MIILYDLFPSHLTVAPAGVYEDIHELHSYPQQPNAYYLQTTRIIVSDTHITVAADDPSGPQIVFRETYSPGDFEKSAKLDEDSYLTTTSGKMLVFKKDTNCGCGSRLRAWNPYKTLGSIKDPTE
jgi:hypothetical protein